MPGLRRVAASSAGRFGKFEGPAFDGPGYWHTFTEYTFKKTLLILTVPVLIVPVMAVPRFCRFTQKSAKTDKKIESGVGKHRPKNKRDKNAGSETTCHQNFRHAAVL